MKTSGASAGLLPATLAVTFKASAAVRLAWATSAASAPRRACSFSHPLSTLETCSVGGPIGFVKDPALSRKSPGWLAALPRFRDRPSLRSDPLRDPKWLGFCQSDLDVATEGSQPAAYSFPVGEVGIEERYSVDAPIRDAQVTRLQINPAEREGL